MKGGRCEACSGDGIIRIEMHFLSDVYIPCEVCKGRRYNRETLEVKYKGKSIYDVLDMNVTEALEFFRNIPSITQRLTTLEEVGLGYIKLGQPSTQLSGGEAQRVLSLIHIWEISSQTVDQIVDQLMALEEGTRLTVLAPVVRERKGEHEKILERILKEGFTRVRVDGEIKDLHEDAVSYTHLPLPWLMSSNRFKNPPL